MNPLKMIKTKKKYVMWGAGGVGTREIHRLSFWIDIAFIVDSNIDADTERLLYGYKV